MTGTEYNLKFELERPREVYFAMNAARHVLYRDHPAAAPIGKVELAHIEGHGIVKDEESRERYLYVQFSTEELPEKLEDTLDARIKEFSICSPNFSADESERNRQRDWIHELLKAEGQWTLGVDYQLLKLKWYE